MGRAQSPWPDDEASVRELGVGELLPLDLAAAAGERHPDGFDAVLDVVNYPAGALKRLKHGDLSRSSG